MATYRKLDADEWSTIRRRYGTGESPRALASEFGIAESTLYRRRNLEQWVRPLVPAVDPWTASQGSCEAPCEDVLAADVECEAVGAAGTDANVGALIPDALTTQVGQSISADHAATARRLRRKINQLLNGEALGASADRQPQAVKDLAMALERLQKIERLALGLDDHPPERIPGVVIVIPAKLSPDEWVSRAGSTSIRPVPLRIRGC